MASANNPLLLGFFLFLLLSVSVGFAETTTEGSETPTAYELLEQFDFPKGILPEGVQSYVLNEDGSFEVYFNSSCEFKVTGYMLKYGSKVSGKVRSGSLTSLKGVSVRVLFVWFGIDEVVRSGDEQLSFYVGPLSASFATSNFDECPRCSCGFDCSSSAAARAAAAALVSSS